MAEEKTTIVREGGSAGAVMIGIGIIVLAAVLFLVFGQGMLSETRKIDADVTIETPANK